jgi:hypothetical protein
MVKWKKDIVTVHGRRRWVDGYNADYGEVGMAGLGGDVIRRYRRDSARAGEAGLEQILACRWHSHVAYEVVRVQCVCTCSLMCCLRCSYLTNTSIHAFAPLLEELRETTQSQRAGLASVYGPMPFPVVSILAYCVTETIAAILRASPLR